MKQEIAKTRILPFSHFWARNSYYNTPCGALFLHWIVTAISIVFAPGGTAAPTLSVNIQTLLILVLAATLLPQAIALACLTANLGVMVLSWWPALDHRAGFIVLATATWGLLYWAVYVGMLPKLGYDIHSFPDEFLMDGTRMVTYRRIKAGFARRLEGWVLRRRGRNEEY